MSYYLFLDDMRMPLDVTWVNLPRVQYEVVRDYNEFVDYITTHGVPKFVTFDHDLADEHYEKMLSQLYNPSIDIDYGSEKTGYDCAKWLVDYCADHDEKFPDYDVHSKNPVGRENIISFIQNAKKHLDI